MRGLNDMEIIFYNITALVLGCLLIYYGLFCLIKKNKKLFGGLTLGVSAFYIGFGIWGFFLTDYQFLVILAILAFTLIEIIFFVLFNKKEAVKRNGNNQNKKKEEKDSDYLEEEKKED